MTINPRFMYFERCGVFVVVLATCASTAAGAVQAVLFHCSHGVGAWVDPSPGTPQPGRPRCLHVRMVYKPSLRDCGSVDIPGGGGCRKLQRERERAQQAFVPRASYSCSH